MMFNGFAGIPAAAFNVRMGTLKNCRADHARTTKAITKLDKDLAMIKVATASLRRAKKIRKTQ